MSVSVCFFFSALLLYEVIFLILENIISIVFIEIIVYI